MISEKNREEILTTISLAWLAYVFWSFLVEFFSMVYFLNLSTLSINAGILYLLFLFVPTIFGVKNIENILEKRYKYFPLFGLIGFAYYFSEQLQMRVMAIAVGFLFFYSFWTLEWRYQRIDCSQVSTGFVTGLLTFLLARFVWFSRNILWYSSVSIVIAVILTLVAIIARLKTPELLEKKGKDEQSSRIFRISSFSVALFFSHLLFSNYGIIPRWVGTNPPSTGIFVILALTTGMVFLNSAILRTSLAGIVGLIGVTLINYASGWIGIIGGILLGILIPSLWNSVVSTFPEMDMKREFPTAIGIYLFLTLAVIFATVYDYVPLGELFREREELFLVLATAFLYFHYAQEEFSPTLLTNLRKQKPQKPAKQTIIAVILIVLLLPMSFGMRFALSNRAQAAENELVAVTFNIQQGFDEKGLVNFETVANIIEDLGATIVGLQETDTLRPTSSGRDIMEWLGWRLGMHYYAGPKTRDSTFGNGLLSTFPIVAAETIILPSEGELAVLIKAKINVNNIIVNVLVAHFGETEKDRTAQAEKTAQIIKAMTGPLILLGDFNSEPRSTQIKKILQTGLIDAYAIMHNQRHIPTVIGGNATIDFVFYRGLQLRKSGVIQGYTGSDHRPVYAIFELPKTG